MIKPIASIRKILAGSLILGTAACAVPLAAPPALAADGGESATTLTYTKPVGWAQKDDGKWVFFQEDGTMYTDDWMNESGIWYHFDKLGIMASGVVSIDGVYERFSSSGAYQGRVTGWCTDLDAGVTYYMDAEGRKVTGEQTIGGSTYYFDNHNGMLCTGGWWCVAPLSGTASRFFYTSDTGVVNSQAVGSKWVYAKVFNSSTWMVEQRWAYLTNGQPIRSAWAQIDGSWYYFDALGLAYAGGTYTIAENGVAKKYTFANDARWVGNSGKWASFTDSYGQTQWSYIGSDGLAVTGWKTINGKDYYFDAQGVMVYGANTIGGTTYFFDQSGALYSSASLRGWKLICDNKLQKYSNWYYFDNTGKPMKGWQFLGGQWYYLDSEGKAVTGQYSINGKQYYLYPQQTGSHPACSMAVGWVLDTRGNWLYANSDGSLVTGKWLLLGNTWYYLDAYGVMITDWEKIGGYWYYFGDDGALRTNTVVQGIYRVDGDGRWIP